MLFRLVFICSFVPVCSIPKIFSKSVCGKYWSLLIIFCLIKGLVKFFKRLESLLILVVKSDQLVLGVSVSKFKVDGAMFPVLAPLSMFLFLNKSLTLLLKFSTSFVFSLTPSMSLTAGSILPP